MKQQDLFDLIEKVKALSLDPTWSLNRCQGGWTVMRVGKDEAGRPQTVLVETALAGGEAKLFLEGLLAGVAYVRGT